jgi:hypothetical protein
MLPELPGTARVFSCLHADTACGMCAEDVADWTLERHALVTWLYNGSDFSGLVDSMLAAGYPFLSWKPALAACMSGHHFVHHYQTEAERLVAAGYAGAMSDMPITTPEKELAGRMYTLLSLHENIAPVAQLTSRYVRLAVLASRIAALRGAAFVVDGHIQWPQLKDNTTAWWVAGVRRPEVERTAELVHTPVFHLA